MPSTNVIIHQRRHTYDVRVQLIVWDCPSCGIVYGIPKDFADACRRNGERYYCPNGHNLGWDESDADRERKRALAAETKAQKVEQQLAAERTRRDQAEAEAEHQRNRVKGYQGALGKAKKRAAAGVCPAPGCKRSFADVARHVATCHPDLASPAAADA